VSATDAPSHAVDEQALVDFTQRLVRIRSVHEPETGGNESVAAKLVADLMRDFGWEPDVVEVAPGRPNVLAIVEGHGGDGPTLGFEGHTDVVTEGVLAEWSIDPYGAEIRDGRLYGRGSADMKAGVAAMLFGVRALQLAGPFPGRVALLVFADEEGMMLGAKHFSASAMAGEVDACIVCEPEGGEVCTSAKGAVRIGVELRGVMAHGAMPQKGRNPVVALGRLLVALATYEQQLRERHGEHEHLGPVFVTPTVLDAGSADQVNVIPATARLKIDIRTIPGVDHAELVDDIRALAVEAGAPLGVTAELQVIDDRPAVEIDPGHPVVRAVVAAHAAELGESPSFGGVPGATDGTILTRDAGIPTVVYGPGGKWIAHQVDEYVEVAELERYARVYARAAREYLAGSGR
jgi:succinyl-diaminopimelate desuccinylase